MLSSRHLSLTINLEQSGEKKNTTGNTEDNFTHIRLSLKFRGFCTHCLIVTNH